MSDAPDWPSYQIGPRDSAFALGVISTNYAQLEFATQLMFGSIMGLNMTIAHFTFARLTPGIRDALMRQALPLRGWEQQVSDLAFHFIEGCKVCNENRNKLMHSNLMSNSQRAIVLYKTDRDGKTTLTNPTLKELRQVADDMHLYFNFGLHLSNMINLEVLGMEPRPGDPWFRSWPNKPLPPTPLEYKANPSPLRSLD